MSLEFPFIADVVPLGCSSYLAVGFPRSPTTVRFPYRAATDVFLCDTLVQTLKSRERHERATDSCT